MKFFLCKICGNIVDLVHNGGGPLVCCGAEMTLLVPNTVEASTEKHLPHVTKTDCGINVKVGSVAHPMEAAHYINFICVKSDRGISRMSLSIGDAPEADFCLCGNTGPIEVYEYCNLHGLWKVEV